MAIKQQSDQQPKLLNKEIGFWNGAFDADLPAAIGPVALNVENLSVSTYSASVGYNYAVFHFGAGPARSPGGWWQAVYLGGLGGSFSVPTVDGQSVGGFSSARFYNPVPDSGSAAMLLGTALLVSGARRRFHNSLG